MQAPIEVTQYSSQTSYKKQLLSVAPCPRRKQCNLRRETSCTCVQMDDAIMPVYVWSPEVPRVCDIRIGAFFACSIALLTLSCGPKQIDVVIV